MAGVGGGNDLSRFNQGGGVPGFAGGNVGPGVRETREERNTRLEAEDRKNDALNDPYGNRGQNPNTPETNRTTQTVMKKVRKRRNNGQTEGSNGTSNADGATGNRGANRTGYAQTGPNSLLNRAWNGQASLVRASVLHQNSQAQNLPQQPNGNLATRNKMLQGIGQYIQNDYSQMKLNPDDKAFTYRTAEACQLSSTIGQMMASTSRQADGDKKTTGTTGSTNGRLSDAAMGRQKSLLRRCAAMSDPNPKMPDNLPADYQPYESVA